MCGNCEDTVGPSGQTLVRPTHTRVPRPLVSKAPLPWPQEQRCHLHPAGTAVNDAGITLA